MFSVFVTAEADSEHRENASYLLEEWDLKTATDYYHKVEAVLNLLETHPFLFPTIDETNFHRGVVCKQITILYRVDKAQKLITVLSFWNTSQNPKSREEKLW